MNGSSPALSWVQDPLQDVMQPEFILQLPRSAQIAVFLSSSFSYALAKTYLLTSLSHDLSLNYAPSSAAFFIFTFCFWLIAFFIGTFFMSQVARLATNEPRAYSYWISLGIVATIPLHLMLPLALLCRPLADVGRLIYALGGITVWCVIIRRWAYGAQLRYYWPFWGALLVVLSPFLLGSLMLLLFAAFLVMVVSLAVLGMLA